MNLNRELKKIGNYDIVSFDIFDTLITRNVDKVTDIFFLAGMNVFEKKEDAEKFRKNRIFAEKIARTSSPNGEVSLDDIYNKIKCYSVDLTKKLKDAEIEMEIASCRPRAEIVLFYEKVCSVHDNTILISDMYLPKGVIDRMLVKCGIRYNKIFISNLYGCNKISGELYVKSQQELGVLCAKHLHYGDSIKADFIGAIKKGIAPRLILKENFCKRLVRSLFNFI